MRETAKFERRFKNLERKDRTIISKLDKIDKRLEKLMKLDDILKILKEFKKPTVPEKVVSCIAGFDLIEGKCIDVDECKTAKSKQIQICRDYSIPMTTVSDESGNLYAKTEGKCENTPGSFKCNCSPGFKNKNISDLSSPCIPM